MAPSAAAALAALVESLRRRGYRFVTPTPATHARVIARPERQRARSLTDVFGWSLPFDRDLLDAELFGLLQEAGALDGTKQGDLKSRVRVSMLKGGLYLHSAYPTEREDSVFFGPDSYRFADLIEAELRREPVRPGARIVDIGTGAGVGAIVAATLAPEAEAIGTDINPRALELAGVNARVAGVVLRLVEGEGLAGIETPVDLALANPPYIVDEGGRDYRDGGDELGAQVSIDMARMALAQLAPGGRLILYTGSAIVDGEDRLHAALVPLAEEAGCTLDYRELDPDVFGEELEKPPYRAVDRIAVVAAVFRRRA